jgi:hypothetical protein
MKLLSFQRSLLCQSVFRIDITDFVREVQSTVDCYDIGIFDNCLKQDDLSSDIIIHYYMASSYINKIYHKIYSNMSASLTCTNLEARVLCKD